MKIQEAVLFVATFTSFLSALVDGAKGKGIGESCARYDECGDYPLSFMRCLNSVCSCVGWQYYEPSMEKCVSKIGEKCDAEAPRDGIKLEIKCGENAVCAPLANDRFGRCRCPIGFRESSDGRCSPVPSRWNAQSSSSPSASLPSHPKFSSGSNKVAVDQERGARPDLDNKIVSFPYSSAKSQSSCPKGTLMLTSILAALIPMIPVYFLTS